MRLLTLSILLFLAYFTTAQETVVEYRVDSIEIGTLTSQVQADRSLVLDQGNYTARFAQDSITSSGRYLKDDHTIVLYEQTPVERVRILELLLTTGDGLRFRESGTTYNLSQIIPDSLAETAVLDTEESTTTTSEASADIAIDPTRGGVSFNSIWRGIIGIIFLIALCTMLSSNRRMIDWRLVTVGLSLQILFGVLVLKVDFIATAFDYLSTGVVAFLGKSEEGADFVFGSLIDETSSVGYIFAFKVLPTIVFFSAFTSLLYYLGILQKVVYVFAWVMSKTMRLSGAESLAAAANIFIGQTEAPLVVKPYLEDMTKSELLCLMVGGMATIAGGVLAAFIAFLGGDSPAERIIFTKHLLTASIMSAPAAIVIAKILYPQDQMEKVNRKLEISKDKIGTNILDAISRGTTDGVKLAVNVGAMLLVFTAIMAVVNWMLGDLIGANTGLNDVIASSTEGRYSEFSMQYLLGNLFAPVAWLIGVPSEDITLVGQLLGEKTILNEFFAYTSLSSMKTAGTLSNYRSIVIATYALCGFANFASIGIQIGGIGVLAPSQRGNLARFGVKSLIGGTVAALLTAAIAGMIIGG